jgi:hypothetical protein
MSHLRLVSSFCVVRAFQLRQLNFLPSRSSRPPAPSWLKSILLVAMMCRSLELVLNCSLMSSGFRCHVALFVFRFCVQVTMTWKSNLGRPPNARQTGVAWCLHWFCTCFFVQVAMTWMPAVGPGSRTLLLLPSRQCCCLILCHMAMIVSA